MSDKEIFVSVGRRKTAIARARLSRGTGKILVNDKEVEKYFGTQPLTEAALLPVATASLQGAVDADITVKGGGLHGQAGAVSHSLARAIEKFNPELRAVLKKAGLITRDPRAKERKKSGQPGARKRFQFSKR